MAPPVFQEIMVIHADASLVTREETAKMVRNRLKLFDEFNAVRTDALR